MIKEIRIPEIGENVDSGEVVKVHVAPGDMVQIDGPILELETEKAVVDIPSPEKGQITQILVTEGETVHTGQVIAMIETEVKVESTKVAEETAKEKPAEKKPLPESEPVEPAKPPARGEADLSIKAQAIGPAKGSLEKAAVELTSTAGARVGPAPAAPTVRRLARELGADINLIKGTGAGGRITEEDVKLFVQRSIKGVAEEVHEEEAVRRMPDFAHWGPIDRKGLIKVRRIIAENTSLSWKTIPHVTQFDEADISEFQHFRKRYSKKVEDAGGKLTITAVLLKVIAAALKVFPRFNASLDLPQNEIIYKNYYHVGMAVDTERGLLVPVIRDVDKKTILELAIEVTQIAERTRNKKITPDELEGGTFTISNQGGIGGTDFTPIIFWPQVAILGVSRASAQPVYVDGQLQPRTVLPLSLSYDHRVNDGADAARFLSWVVEALEHPFLLSFGE